MQSFPSGFQKANLQQEAETLLKWGADYLISAWNPNTQSFVAVVGDNTTGGEPPRLALACEAVVPELCWCHSAESFRGLLI